MSAPTEYLSTLPLPLTPNPLPLPRAFIENLRRIKGGNRAPAPLLMGTLERKEGATFVPSAAAPPRSQLLDSEVTRLLL